MKAKINLHNRPNRPNGRIDTYQPYNKQQQRDQQQKDQQQAKNTVLVDRENRLNSAYSVNYNQACLLLQAVQMYGRRRLSSECLVQLAKFVAAAWETSPSQDKINALCQLMTNLLDTTLLCPEKPFDEALRQFCRNNIPTHSVSPSITLLIAIGYIERLKQKYTHIKGTTGCGHRLIMVAYMMAAKYMHVNLRFIVNTTASSSETSSTTITAPSSPTAATIPSTTTNLAHTSAERSTIRNNNNNAYTPSAKLPPILSNSKSEQLPSPPTSPKAYSDSDPLNYHYFQSRNNQMSITTTTPTPTTTSTINNDTLPPIHHIDRHFHILRMELEFLHFLNYDLSLSDTMRLIHWAQRFDDHNNNNLSSNGASSTVAESNGESHYSSGDEGGDEWEADGH